jgi:hypothetical protein
MELGCEEESDWCSMQNEQAIFQLYQHVLHLELHVFFQISQIKQDKSIYYL